MDKQQVISQENLHSFNYLKNCKKEFIIATILEEFSDEEKKDILRNIEFVKMMDSESLNQIINSMNFTSGFNMLQNKALLEKVTDINIEVIAKEVGIFLKDFLTLIPIKKINHNMLREIIKNFYKHEIIELFKDENIINQLHTSDIIDIAIIKGINLIDDIYLIELFNDNEVYEYVDGFLKYVRPLDWKIINNDYVKNLLFDNDIDFDEVKYLYDYLVTQNNHSIKDVNHSLKAFIKVNSLYKEYGLKGTQELFNTKGIIIDDIFKINNSKKKNKKR